MSTRTFSHSELSRLSLCEAQWDFSYGDTLAGSSLTAKVTAPRLREGRAWGRAVAAWHVSGGDASAARDALVLALADDADEQRAEGVYLDDEHAAMSMRMIEMVDHYAATSTPLRLIDPERHYDVSIPSRTGRRASSVYRLSGYLDGVNIDDDGRFWIVEFKLRGRLSSIEDLALDRQGRRYAWAWSRETGYDVAGVIYDERLNEAPRPPKILASGRPSTDKRQLCTAQDYADACATAGVEPDAEMVDHLGSRVWQSRQRIIFRTDELEETGAELVSLAQRVGELESGRMPIRAANPIVCRGCFFRAICPDPTDDYALTASYRRVPAKRNRPMEVAA